MWRSFECPRFTFPVAVFLKRLAAPLCVFSFGITTSAFSNQQLALGKQKSPQAFSRVAKCQVLSANCDEFVTRRPSRATTRAWRPAPLAEPGLERSAPQPSAFALSLF